MGSMDEEFRLPEPLQRELRGLFAPGAFPAERDGRILAAARHAQSANAVRRWRWAAVGVAAALALATSLWWLPRGQSVGQGGTAYARSGDIRDAYYVARHLQKHEALEPGTWDVNRDGHVDEQDVQALVLVAVKVTPRATAAAGHAGETQ